MAIDSGATAFIIVSMALVNLMTPASPSSTAASSVSRTC